MTRGKLPRKLWKLIRLALSDLETAEKSTKYRINMGTYHEPNTIEMGKCTVCMAGAVMAGTLGCKPEEVAFPWDFGHKDGQALTAIDAIRTGDIQGAFMELGQRPPVAFPQYIEIPRYLTHPNGFKRGLSLLARRLKRVNR